MVSYNKTDKVRIHYFDALKCLGILLVIEGHVRGFGMGINTYDSLSGLMLYSINMPIFFFISGFLAYQTELKPQGTLRKLFHKFVFLVIPAIVFFVFKKLLDHENPLELLSYGSGGYWFTIVLWECFFIYYALGLLFHDNKFRDFILILISLLGIAYLMFYGEIGPKLFEFNRLAKYFQFFVVGLFASKYKYMYEKIITCEALKTIAVVTYFALLFLLDYSFWPRPAFHFLRDIVIRYLGLFVVVSWFASNNALFNKDTKINNLLLEIGKKSLAIYLLQYFFFPDLSVFKSYFNNIDTFSIHIISFVYTIIILSICMVFIKLLSNSKLVRKYLLGQK